MILSFGIAGLICACAALAYAEMATMIPASGSAYTYSYVVIGELLAWVVGWSLILEYSLVVSAVAVGWSGYAAPLLEAWAGALMALMQGPNWAASSTCRRLRSSPSSRAAARRDTRKRDAQCGPRAGEGGRACRVRRGRASRLQRGQSRTVQPLWLCQAYGPRRGRARRHGRGGNHFLRFLRLRCDCDRGRGNPQSRPRPQDRHRRVDVRLRRHLYRGRGRRGRRHQPTAALPTAPSRWR